MTGADDKGATQSYPEQAYSALDKVKFDLIAVRESTRRLSWISRLCGRSTEVEDTSQAGSDLLLFLAEQQTGLCDRIWGSRRRSSASW